jgi:hypothetical protein
MCHELGLTIAVLPILFNLYSVSKAKGDDWEEHGLILEN